MRRKKILRYCLYLAFLCPAYFAPPQLNAQSESEKFDPTQDTSACLLIQAQNENLGNAETVAIQRSQTDPYYNTDLFTSAEARDVNATEIFTLSLHKYIQTLAPLLFHTHQSSSASIGSSEDELIFSDEETVTLWEKAKRGCKAFPSLLRYQQENALEEAHYLYCQARFLAATGLLEEGRKTMGEACRQLRTLWEIAISSEQRPAENLPLNERDPHLAHNPHLSSEVKRAISPFLLPLNHPVRALLDRLCLANRITANEKSFALAGFQTFDRRPRSFICVARHNEMPGYLVKVYLDTVLKKKQNRASWQWLVKRCQGAAQVADIIEQGGIQHFVVAKKWIYCLPPEPSPPFGKHYTRHLALLVVTDMELTPEKENLDAWYDIITPKHLDELYLIMSHAKGSSYRPDNIAYTRTGQFAFIDTEYPSRGPDFNSIRRHLRPSMLTYWDKLVKNGGKR